MGAPSAAGRAEIRELRAEPDRVKRERDILGKAVALLLGVAPEERVTKVYTFIAEEEKANPNCEWSTAEMCRVLEVSRSGFYDWETRPPSDRELSDRQLTCVDRRPVPQPGGVLCQAGSCGVGTTVR